MQTFLKMSSVVYSMAGLGSVEETKYFRDKFGSTTSAPDSLRYGKKIVSTLNILL